MSRIRQRVDKLETRAKRRGGSSIRAEVAKLDLSKLPAEEASQLYLQYVRAPAEEPANPTERLDISPEEASRRYLEFMREL